jgi:hypothetical protein
VREARGSDTLSDQHIALAERSDHPESLSLEHADGPEPSRYGSAVSSGICFHNPTTVTPYRIHGRMKCEARDSRPSGRPIYEETGDPPTGWLAERVNDRLVLAAPLDPRKILSATELTPPHGQSVPVDQNSLSMSPLKQRLMVPPICRLAPCAGQGARRTFPVVEHAPASRLHSVVLAEEHLKIRPPRRFEFVRLEPADYRSARARHRIFPHRELVEPMKVRIGQPPEGPELRVRVQS